jgi:hypothetical protein
MQGKQDICTGAVFLLGSGLLLTQARMLPAGAAFLPSIALGAIMVLSAIMIWRGIRKRRGPGGEEAGAPFIEAPGRLVTGILAMGLYIAAIELVGFYPATAAFVPLTAYVLGARNPAVLAAAGIGFVLFAFIIFDLLFERVMPQGLLYGTIVPVTETTAHA